MSVRITIGINVSSLESQLEAARYAQRISYGELGKVAGVTSSSCWQILNGQSKATKLDTVWKIAEALGVDLRPYLQIALQEQTQIWRKDND